MEKIDVLLDIAKSRRSIRRFKPDPIPDEYVEKMIEVARWSPSGANGQPWEFIIVKDQKTKDEMAELYRQTRYEHSIIEQTRMEDLRQPRAVAPAAEVGGFRDAPVLIVVCGDRRVLQATALASNFIGGEGAPGDGVYLKNIANVTYALHLAAAALGLGAQWCSVNSVWEQMLKPLLGVPLVLQIHTVVPVGYPAYTTTGAYRRRPEEFVHFEKYDMSKFRSGEQIVEFIRELRRRTRSAYDQGRTGQSSASPS